MSGTQPPRIVLAGLEMRSAVRQAEEAEYLAAKAEYLRAQERLRAAKAVWEPIRKRRDELAAAEKLQRREQTMAACLRAVLAGQKKTRVSKSMGCSVESAEWHFFHKYVTDEERKRYDWIMVPEDCRALTELVLQRYQEQQP